jgi:hypothetical protein
MLRKISQKRWERIRAGGKNRFVAYEMAGYGMILIVGTFIFYGFEDGFEDGMERKS